jgi:CheY-like chemotaxis protein
MAANDAGKKLILVVDDEPDVVTYLTTLLEDNGYATDSARDGNEAMDKIKKKKPDLISLDMSMPEKSGVKLYRELKSDESLAGIPVVVVTGVTGFGGSSKDFEKFLGTRKQVPPPAAFIAKPLDHKELLEKVAELLA